MSNSLTLAAKLSLDSNRWNQGLTKAGSGLKGFVGGVKRELTSLKSSLTSAQGTLASIGITVGATALIMQSAKMDKSLTQIGQTAGASKLQVIGLRKELFTMAGQTGQNVDDLQAGFNVLIQSGLTWKESLAVIGATNKTMAVTGAQAETLAGALGVASTAFNYDLSKPNQALALLDKMTVAGRKGNAELQDLSSIVSRVGVNAAGAGFGFDKTLAFVEGLSLIERQPERLATLADSTLRLFTNAKYMEASQKATGVKFFGKDGSRSDPIEVLSKIKKKFDALKTDSQRQNFLTKAFGQADLDTIKGLKTLLSGNNLSNIKQFTNEISNAGGTIERDLPNAVNNAVDQVGRLKTVLREAADGFAKPINETIASITGKLINKKADGGQELDGKQLAMLAGGGVGLAWLTKRFGGALGSKIFGRSAGIAEGKALEAAAGITPVFVTNMSDAGMGMGMPGTGPLAAIPAGGKVAAVGKVAASATIGYAIGTAAYENVLTDQGPAGSKSGQATGEAIGLYVTRQLAPFSSDATAALKTNGTIQGKLSLLIGQLFPTLAIIDAHLSNQSANKEINNNITITPNKDGTYGVKSDNPKAKTTVNTGRMLPMAGKI